MDLQSINLQTLTFFYHGVFNVWKTQNKVTPSTGWLHAPPPVVHGGCLGRTNPCTAGIVSLDSDMDIVGLKLDNAAALAARR